MRNTLLVNNFKYDLRIYVLVPSINPLIIYMYDEGLTRLSSVEYNFDVPWDNQFIHLNNVGQQIKSEDYVHNENVNEDDYGTMWTLSALFEHLEKAGADIDLLWSQIQDIVVKTVIAGEPKNFAHLQEQGAPRQLFFQNMGFDIMLDSSLRPVLLEANCTPLLNPHSPLQATLSGSLVSDLLNVVQLEQVDRDRYDLTLAELFAAQSQFETFDVLRPQEVAPELAAKIRAFVRAENLGPQEEQELLEAASVQNRPLIDYFLELEERKGGYRRLFPAKGSRKYLKYLEDRPANLLLHNTFFPEEDQ